MSKRKDIRAQQSATPAPAETTTAAAATEASAVEAVAATAPAPDAGTAEPKAADASPAEPAAPSPRNRFPLLAASVAVAAALGAAAGSLATMGLAHSLAPAATVAATEAKAADTSPLPGMLAQVSSDIAALKTASDASSRLAAAQFSKIAERFDRVEQRIAAAPAPAQDVTGSVTPARSEVKEPPKPSVLEGWVLRDIYRGRALVESRNGIFEIAAGSTLPGVGRIETITQQNGRWVVVTPKGLIVSMR